MFIHFLFSQGSSHYSPKNKELFWIAYMDRPCVGGVQIVDWWTRQSTHRALKTRSCSRLQPCKVHAWVVFDWWTGAFVDQLVKLKKQEVLPD